ncbi:MAG TPA: SDR family oxidoreductase [Kribbella sp.]|uniref:SDR family oxidoreductase n=1 Tax=Kribbella sp. TaxID=1871183 RepID=UPI002D78B020|nr:SDR family oxidoreductase [Kribbella sp.]HET6298473.1 SDR family oxidoreductase [Kribbella sp.]
MLDLTGRIALVTGGARGVGRRVVTLLAEHGAHVVINCFHSFAEGRALQAELSERGLQVEVVRASVAKVEQVDRMFAEIEERHGRLDILVNNAASGGLRPAAETTEEHFRKALDTNLLGSFWCAERAAKLMPNGGAIVNVSSIGAPMVLDNYLSVGTSKAAVEALSRHLAAEYGPRGIRVNTASCSLVEGEVATLFPRAEEMRQVTVDSTPMGRIATEDDLARIVLFLVSDLACWVTGQTVLGDGGLSLGRAMMSPPRIPLMDQAVEAAVEVAPRAVVEAAPRAVVDGGELAESDPIAVVGMGLRLPEAGDPDELWRLRLSGEHVFTEVPADRWRLDSFHDADPEAPDKTYSRWSGFVSDTAGCEGQDYTARWLRHALVQSLEGVGRDSTDRVSCFVGYTADGSQHLEEAMVLAGLRRRLHTANGTADELRTKLAEHLHRGTGATADFLPHRVGRQAIDGVLPADTELFMVDTACSSSLYAVDLGMKALLAGDCDLAACGGAFALGPRGAVLFSKLGGLARRGSVRSLDRSGDGVLFSDGAGVVILKRLSRALRDGDTILGLLAGVGTSSDGKGKAIYAPSSAGQEIAIHRALEAPGVTPDRIDWVAAHATGTPAGDLAELNALQSSFPPDQALQVTSNKSVIGHTGWAAGVTSLIEVLLGIRHEQIPQQVGFETPPDAFDADRTALRIPRELLPWPVTPGRPRAASVSSFGFGGTNAHIVVEEFQGQRPPVPAIAKDDRIVVVGWSAHVPGLDRAEDVEGWLRGTGPAPDVSFGEQYPVPPFERVRMPPRTLRMLDRCQLMVLECVAKLESALGDVWKKYHDTTGVLAGHLGPTRQATLYALRCHVDDIRTVIGDEPAGKQLLADLEADLERLVPTATEDSFPGIMPNVIPARVANYFDFHGLNMTIDNGLTSTAAALDVAGRYLRSGDLDLALVFGVNGNSLPELADVIAPLLPPDTELAEGAFLLALTRESVAIANGLPALGQLDELVDRGRHDGDAVSDHVGPEGRSYLGADDAVSVLRRLLTGTPAQEAAPDPVDLPASESVPRSVARYEMTLKILPSLPIRPVTELFAPGTLVLTDQPELLVDQTLTGVTVLSTAPVPNERPDWIHLPTVDPEAVSAVLAKIDRPSDLRVVTSLAAAADPNQVWDTSPALFALHDLTFLALQHCHDAIEQAGSLIVLLLGGRQDGSWHPLAGMFTGLVKSAALELPKRPLCTVVTSTSDLATGVRYATAEAAAHQFLPVVVYDNDGERRCLSVVELDDQPGDGPNVARLDSDSVVVACGGARGIGAEALKALAENSRPIIYILGTTPLDGYDDADLADDTDDRVAYLRTEKARRPDATVAELTKEYDTLTNARAARRNLAAMAEYSGADRVHYLTCDLRDREQVVQTMTEILGREGRIDLLLNVAGLNRAASIPTKKWDDFRSVRDVKVQTYLNLRYALRDQPPRVWCNFGSFVGFTGQVGEVDYAAGNDFLNTAAAHTVAVGRDEVTIGWALWRSTGLGANPVTKAFLEKSGLFTSISTEEGVALFLAELGRPRDEPVVVHLGDVEKRAIEDHLPGFFVAVGNGRGKPFYLDIARRSRFGKLWAERSFDLSRDGYLAHHVVNGHATLPGTFVPEIAAQAAQELVPGMVPAGFEDVTFHAFLRVFAADRPVHKKIQAEVISRDELETVVKVRILGDVLAANGTVLRTDKLHFEALVRMRAELPPAPTWDLWTPGEDERPVADPYHVANPVAHLTGPLVSTADTRMHRLGRRARFAPQVDPDDPVFSTFTVPSLLLDGLARLSVLEPDTDGFIPLAAPLRIRRIDLYELRNDCQLAAAYPTVELYSSPRWVDLEAERPDNRCLAVAPDGRVLLQIKDIAGVVLGSVHPATGEFRPRERQSVPSAVAGGR